MLPRWLALVVVLALSGCMPSFRAIDIGKPLTDKDLALAFTRGGNSDADEFAEQLVIRSNMDDDVSVYAKLTVTNLASADGRADLTVNVTLADGRKLVFKARRDRDEWTYGRDRFFAEVGDGSVEVSVGRVRVIVKNDEFELDFEVTSALPPLRPKGLLFDRGGRFYMATIPIPRGAARAHIKVLTPPPEDEDDEEEEAESEDPGEPAEIVAPLEIVEEEGPTLPAEIEVEGIGYAEHRAGNVAPYVLARRWYSVLDIGEDATVMLSVFEHAQPEGEKRDPQAKPQAVQGFFYACSDDALILYEPEVTLRVRGWYLDDKTSYPIPKIVFVNGMNGSTFEGVIVANTLSNRKDDLQSLSKLERIVVRKFMKPWTFRFDRAQYLFRKQDPGESMRDVRGEERLQVQQLN